MKKFSVLVATAIVAMGMVSCGDSHKSASLKTGADSVSYAIGITTGAGYKENLKTLPGDPANVDDLIAGFIQAIKGDSAAMKMTPQEAQAYMQTYFMQAATKEAENNKAEGEKFLAENAKKEGVTVTKSGLQYEVLVEGTGKKPKATDTVRCHYEGRLLDGTVFDSSYKRNEPADFGLQQVIAGWTEGVQLMGEGAKFRFYIPYLLAYGEGGAGGMIPPFATLIFDVELIKVL